jgi:hypothetical protein
VVSAASVSASGSVTGSGLRWLLEYQLTVTLRWYGIRTVKRSYIRTLSFQQRQCCCRR